MDKQRLARQVASAMADGTDIGWDALLDSARTPAERADIERLRGLDVLRRPPVDEDQASVGPVTDAIILLIAAVAGAQVLVALATFTFDLVANIPARWPLPQLAITLAFTAAAGMLSRARHDRRSLPLLAAYLTAAAAFCRPFVRAGYSMGLTAPLFVGVTLDAFTPACLWYFALQFPRVRVSRASMPSPGWRPARAWGLARCCSPQTSRSGTGSDCPPRSPTSLGAPASTGRSSRCLRRRRSASCSGARRERAPWNGGACADSAWRWAQGSRHFLRGRR